ncbi:hypothetical protein CONPUDRAFT_26644, partial [Coniophora puteana RWD-64-598 SS2]
RYRNVPTFGRGTIRRFHRSACDMKRLAARDFEDLLQCAMPVFDSVFPDRDHGKIILDLLFEYANWHAHAKLRLHTDDTLELFDQATVTLGQTTRKLQKLVCPAYDTRELPSETGARHRRAAKLHIKNGKNPQLPGRAHAVDASRGVKPKRLNLETYKYHALGDHPNTIRQVGTTDNYTSQLV